VAVKRGRGGANSLSFGEAHVAFGSIVLKKSFFAMTENFSGPLVRRTRRDVRDHIKYSKTGCWRSYRFYRASQRLKSPTCIICEILEACDFRVFQHNRSKAEVPAPPDHVCLTPRSRHHAAPVRPSKMPKIDLTVRNRGLPPQCLSLKKNALIEVVVSTPPEAVKGSIIID
jgi:hypothetical protein